MQSPRRDEIKIHDYRFVDIVAQLCEYRIDESDRYKLIEERVRYRLDTIDRHRRPRRRCERSWLNNSNTLHAYTPEYPLSSTAIFQTLLKRFERKLGSTFGR